MLCPRTRSKLWNLYDSSQSPKALCISKKAVLTQVTRCAYQRTAMASGADRCQDSYEKSQPSLCLRPQDNRAESVDASHRPRCATLSEAPNYYPKKAGSMKLLRLTLWSELRSPGLLVVVLVCFMPQKYESSPDRILTRSPQKLHTGRALPTHLLLGYSSRFRRPWHARFVGCPCCSRRPTNGRKTIGQLQSRLGNVPPEIADLLTTNPEVAHTKCTTSGFCVANSLEEILAV